MDVALSDAEVVRRIAAGPDHEAEGELFRRMAPRIRLYGLRHLRDRHAAEDLTQQVLITTLEALRDSRLREPEKLASFVLGTCRMTVIDLRRSAQRRARLLEQFGVDSLRPSRRRPNWTMTGYALPGEARERERTVVVMTFYDERTGADVAGFLGVSESHLRVIRHWAIESCAVHGGRGVNIENGEATGLPASIDAAVLVDYWLAVLAGADEESVEEHLLESEPVRRPPPRVIALAEGCPSGARPGSADGGERRVPAAGGGGRLAHSRWAPPCGGSVRCTVTADGHLLIGRLVADLSGASHR